MVHGTEKFADRLKAEANVAAKRDAARWRFETEGQIARSQSETERTRTTSLGNNSISSIPAYGYRKPCEKSSKADNRHEKSWNYYYDNEAFSDPYIKKEIPQAEKVSARPEIYGREVGIIANSQL